MTTTEIIALVLSCASLASIIVSWVVLYFTDRWKAETEAKLTGVINAADGMETHLNSMMIGLKADLYVLKEQITNFGLETMKVRSKDHDRAIESIRKDLLDLQVICGTLPSRAGDMLHEVENAVEQLEALQRDQKEARAIVDKTKEQVEKLAEAYSSLHFTSKEIEEMRNELEYLKFCREPS